MIRKLRNSLLALASTGLVASALMATVPVLRDGQDTMVAGQLAGASALATNARIGAQTGADRDIRRGSHRHGRNRAALPYFSFAARSLTP